MFASTVNVVSISVATLLLAIFVWQSPVGLFLNQTVQQAQLRLLAPTRGRRAQTTLWAWDCPENLLFLRGTGTQVAFYAGTMFIDKNGMRFIPRMKPLLVDATTKTYPVFRIESRVEAPSKELIADITATIVDFVRVHPADKIQIDYDATESERKFYLDLLKDLRSQLGPKRVLSVTALASWCLDDRWLDGAPIDEAVVMLFSMGPGQASVIEALRKQHLRIDAPIKLSLGISANESATNEALRQTGVLPSDVPIYLFNSLPWSAKRFGNATVRILNK